MLLHIAINRSIVCHDHIQLPCVDRYVSQYLEPLYHKVLVISFEPGDHAVLTDLYAKIEFFEDLFNESEPEYTSVEVCPSPLEVEAHIVFSQIITQEGLYGRQMVSQSRTKIAEIFRYHEVILLGVTGSAW